MNDWIRLHLALIRIPAYDGGPYQQMGSAHQIVNCVTGEHWTISLGVDAGHSAALYVVWLTLLSLQPNGWRQFRATVSVNNTTIGRGEVPGAYYEAVPTDRPTELLQFNEICGPIKPNTYPQQYDPAGSWLLALHRNK